MVGDRNTANIVRYSIERIYRKRKERLQMYSLYILSFIFCVFILVLL
jgi:hypothetical protein